MPIQCKGGDDHDGKGSGCSFGEDMESFGSKARKIAESGNGQRSRREADGCWAVGPWRGSEEGGDRILSFNDGDYWFMHAWLQGMLCHTQLKETKEGRAADKGRGE